MQISIKLFPYILVLALKRSYDHWSGKKTSDNSIYIYNNLVFTDSIGGKNDKIEYILVGIIHHFGSFGSDDYITDWLDLETKNAYRFYDSQVSTLENNCLGNQKSDSAYILFYQKIKKDQN